MRRSLLGAAMVAAMAFALGTGTYAADLHVYGGGGGGGGGAESDTTFGKGGLAGAGATDTDASKAGQQGAVGADSNGVTGGGGGAGGGSGTPEAQKTGMVAAGADGEDAADFDSDIATGTYGTVLLDGGEGGVGGNAADAASAVAGTGGDGGGVNATAGGDLTITTLTITGGDGGNGGTGTASKNGAEGEGGVGGSVTFDATGKKVTLMGAASSVTAGSAGTANDGGAGDAGGVTFNVGVLASGDDSAKIAFDSNSIASSLNVTIGEAQAVDNNLELDFSSVDTAAEASLGKVTIGDGSGTGKTFKIDGVTRTDYEWTGALSVNGVGNTLTGTLDATGTSENSLEFDFNNKAASATAMLTGTVTMDADTAVSFKNATASHLGGAASSTLVSAGAGNFAGDATKTGTITDSDSNSATLGAVLYNDTGALKFYGNSLNATGNWTQDAALNLATSANVNAINYKVAGELTLPDSINLTFDASTGSGQTAIVDIATLNVEDASTVTFTNTAVAADTGNGGSGTNYAKIGDIILQADSNLTLAGTQYAGENDGSETFEWSGNLTTFDKVTLGGANLSGKRITANLSAGFDLENDTMITGGTGGLTVSDATKVHIVADKALTDALRDNANAAVTIFANAVTGVALLEDEEFTLESGGYDGTGLFDVDGTSQAESIEMKLAGGTGEEGLAYNKLLAMPAVVTLVNGGGDVVEKVTSAFSPMSFRQNSALSGVQFGAFASLGGGHIEVDTGSGVDSDNFHMLVGPGIRVATGTGTTDFGAFFEAGWGGYDAYNATYRGEGDTSYYGGGLLVRHETCSGLYGEASLRIGGAKSKYNSSRINNDFETKSTYFGGHVGLGYIFRPTATSSVDVFAKGLLTRMGSDKATDESDYEVAIDSTTSVRTHLGAKYSYNFLPNASFFVKGVWEHEFDGETGGRYDNIAIKRNANMGGSSAIGEIGVEMKAAERVTLGASIYGVVGQRQGFGGNVNIGLGF